MGISTSFLNIAHQSIKAGELCAGSLTLSRGWKPCNFRFHLFTTSYNAINTLLKDENAFQEVRIPMKFIFASSYKRSTIFLTSFQEVGVLSGGYGGNGPIICIGNARGRKCFTNNGTNFTKRVSPVEFEHMLSSILLLDSILWRSIATFVAAASTPVIAIVPKLDSTTFEAAIQYFVNRISSMAVTWWHYAIQITHWVLCWVDSLAFGVSISITSLIL